MSCYYNKHKMATTYQAAESLTRFASKVPPFVISSSDPANTATGVAINKTINVTMSIGLDPTTVNSTNITLTPGPVATTVSLHTDGRTVIIDPNTNLANNTLYTITVTTNVRGLYGGWSKVPLAPQATVTFTTVP
jgi:hypothetical protein